MRNTRTCPKCGGHDIAVVDGYAGAYGSGNHIMLGKTVFSAARVDRYICGFCGYTEEWIRPEDLQKLAKSDKWHR